MNKDSSNYCRPVDISEEDITKAMKSIPGYLDITPGDFRLIYSAALKLAFRRLSESAIIEEVMSREVISVQEDMTLAEAAKIMAEAGISGVPVLDSAGHVIGVLSEADFLKSMAGKKDAGFMGVIADCLSGSHCLAAPARAKKVSDLMTSPAIIIAANHSVFDASSLMTEKKINRLPVVDIEGRSIGIVTRADLLSFSFPLELE